MKQITHKLYTMPGWYAMWRPVAVRYETVIQKAKDAGYTVLEKHGIWEQAPMFGRGWIGVVVESDNKDLQTIDGSYEVVSITGAYSQMADVYKKLMKKTKLVENYNVYFNSPREVSQEELRTDIVYRSE